MPTLFEVEVSHLDVNGFDELAIASFFSTGSFLFVK
jgi:hypothetical protein